MEAVITMIAAGIMCSVCFMLGAKVGQTVSKGEDVKMPTVNPMEIVRRNEARKEEQAEQNRIDTILRNIESYDGTGNNQEDVPRG